MNFYDQYPVETWYKKLHLYYIRNITEEILKYADLEELHFWQIQFTQVPAILSKLPKLTTFSIANGKLEQIEPEIFQLPLVSLGLLEVKLVSIPKQIGQMLTLRTLDLTENLLETFDRELCQLTNLTHLYLSNNRLKSLPQEFGNLVALEEIDLDCNRLSAFPPCGSLTKLTSLDISDNLIEKLPRSMRSVKLEVFLAFMPKFSDMTNLNLERVREINCTIAPSQFFYTNKADMWFYNGVVELGYINLVNRTDKHKYDYQWHGLETLL